MNPTLCRNSAIISLFLTFALLSCEEHNAPSPENHSYFPLDEHRKWQYQRWIANGLDDSPGHLFDTLNLTIGNDVTVDGKLYKEIAHVNGAVDKIVRIEGSKYFARKHELYQADFSHEYVFLDTEKAVGEAWSYIKDQGYSKTEYVIQAKDATHTILGVNYENVIEVRVNYYHQAQSGEFERWATVIHYYAEGVGEIYHFYPYPTLVYGDLSAFIMNDKK
jgi:hypothetical protein